MCVCVCVCVCVLLHKCECVPPCINNFLKGKAS